MTSLRRYFQTSFLQLTILPLLLLGGTLSWFIFYNQLSSDTRFVQRHAEDTAAEIEDFFRFQNEEILDITRFHNFLSLAPPTQREILLEALHHQPPVEEMVLLDSQGRVLQHISTVSVFTPEEESRWPGKKALDQVLQTGQPCYSAIGINADSLQPFIQIAIPFRAPGQSEISAIFAIKLRLQFLQRLIQEMEQISPGKTTYLTEGNNQIISHPNPSHVLAKRNFAPVAENDLQRGLDGRWAIIRTARVELGKQQLNVIVEQDALLALMPAWRATALSSLVLLLSLIAAIYFNRTARRQIVEPVLALTSTAQAISEGNLSRQAEVSGHQEIRQLATTFNSMIGELFNSLNNLEAEVKERKNIEQQLLRTQQSLAFHLENTPVGAVVWDADTKVVEWNPAAEKIFGYSKAEVLGKSCFKLIIADADEPELKKVFKDLLERRSGFVNINENITKDGRTIVCEWNNTPLVNEQGDVYGIAALVIDISERERLKELMVQSEKLLSLGNMAAGIAHELNNPLAAILQNAQVLKIRLLQESSQNSAAANRQGCSHQMVLDYARERKLPECIEAINDAGQRAARIITSMLSFSRKENDQQQLCDLPSLIDQVLELLASNYSLEKKFDFRQVSIKRDYQAELPALPCEPSQIQQVLLNLLNNAAQAMAEAGTRAPEIEIALHSDEQSLQLQIKDNGPGMAQETRAKIFEPFFTTKQVGQGTGLGLSICYHIITKNYQGSMQVDSTPGAGSCFTIRLPLSA